MSPSKDIASGSPRLIPLPSTPEPSEFRRVSFCLPTDPEWTAVFWGVLIRMTWWGEWQRDEQKRGKDVARFWANIINAGRREWLGLGTLDCDEITGCEDFPPNADFIEWQPQNPFTQPNYTPEGFLNPPWKVVQEGDLPAQLLGLQIGDVYTSYDRFPDGSLPTVIPPDGFARFRITYTAPAEIELHLLQFFGGGLVTIQKDGNPLTVEFLQTNKDVISIPPETVSEIVHEMIDEGIGEHFYDVTFIPYVNDQAPYIYYGGGLRKVTICGEDIMGKFDVRQNESSPCILEKTEDGSNWTQWANLRLCPPRLRYRGTVIELQNDQDEWIPLESTPPSGTGDVFPPAPPRVESDADQRRCLASANAANTIKLMHFSVVENYQDNFLAVTATAVVSILAAVIFPPSVPLALGALTTAAGATTLGTLVFGDFTADIESELTCILYENASDNNGVITFDFPAVQSAVAAKGVGIGTTFAMWQVIWYYLQIIQAGGLNLAGATTAVTDADCACSEYPDLVLWDTPSATLEDLGGGRYRFTGALRPEVPDRAVGFRDSQDRCINITEIHVLEHVTFRLLVYCDDNFTVGGGSIVPGTYKRAILTNSSNGGNPVIEFTAVLV